MRAEPKEEVLMRSTGRFVSMVVAIACVMTALASAQVTSTETRSFEVVAVHGNDLVVKTPEGTRELTVPADFRFTVDGRQVPVQDLKPGMTGTATITTRTTMTPVTVTQIKEGTVAQVSGNGIVVRTDEGLRSFTQSDLDKRAIKIVREGKPAKVSDFRTGDRLTATIITSLPPATVTEREVQAVLSAPAPPLPTAAATVGAEAPSLPAVATTGSAPVQAPAPVQELPKTASPLPLVGLVGLASLAIGAALAIRRHRVRR
jgi:hypothetical protein